MESVVYEDCPRYDVSYLIGPIVFVAFLLGLALYFYVNDPVFGLLLFAPALVVGVTNWALLPRKLCILDDRIKIVQGGPFSSKILFNTIESAHIVTTESHRGIFAPLRINWETCHSINGSIEIIRKGALRVTISPQSPELFLENLNKALNSWQDSGRIT